MSMKIEKSVPTPLLEEYLKSSNTFAFYKDDYAEELITIPPHQYLNEKMTQKGLQIADVYTRSGLESYCYRIFTGNRRPSRDVLLRIILSLEMELEEAQETLRVFEYARLDARQYRDAAIMFGIGKKMNVEQLNDLLAEIDENTL